MKVRKFSTLPLHEQHGIAEVVSAVHEIRDAQIEILRNEADALQAALRSKPGPDEFVRWV